MSKKTTQKILYILSLLALVVLILDIHNLSKGALFFMITPNGTHWLAFKKIWLPEMPFLVFLIAIIISTYFKWHYILWAFPLISIRTLHNQIWYLIHYHTYITNFYLWFQIFSLLTSILLIAGMIVGMLRLYTIYNKE